MNQAGFRVVVSTNQSGIARGLFSIETLNAIHQKMHAAAQQVGIEPLHQQGRRCVVDFPEREADAARAGHQEGLGETDEALAATVEPTPEPTVDSPAPGPQDPLLAKADGIRHRLDAIAAHDGLLGLSFYPHHLRGGSACRLEDFAGMVARLAERTYRSARIGWTALCVWLRYKSPQWWDRLLRRDPALRDMARVHQRNADQRRTERDRRRLFAQIPRNLHRAKLWPTHRAKVRRLVRVLG